jgi:hypothetical protein
VSTQTVKRALRRAEDSTAADWGARAGLVARGILWLVVGILAARIAVGDHAKADRAGALQTLKDQPLGMFLLVLLAVAFAAHAAYRLLEGTVGRRDEDDDLKRLLKRLWSLCRVGVYGALAVSTVRFLTAGGGSSEDPSDPTAEFMGLPAGRSLVGLPSADCAATSPTSSTCPVGGCGRSSRSSARRGCWGGGWSTPCSGRSSSRRR